MVPMDQPEQAEKMLLDFIYNRGPYHVDNINYDSIGWADAETS